MPELPEAETTRRQLECLVTDSVTGFSSTWPAALKVERDIANLAKDIRGRQVLAVKRWGKVVYFELAERILALHMRMSGRLILGKGDATKATRHTFTFKSERKLYFDDERKFGDIWYGPAKLVFAHSYFAKLGPDALEITPQDFSARLKARKGMLKAALLDQAVVAGLGNYLVDELLWQAELNPKLQTKQLTQRQLTRLFEAMHKVLAASLKAKGLSLRNWRQPDQKQGSYKQKLKVYGRAGQPCLRCGQQLQAAIVAGRGTTFCPQCQPQSAK